MTFIKSQARVICVLKVLGFLSFNSRKQLFSKIYSLIINIFLFAIIIVKVSFLIESINDELGTTNPVIKIFHVLQVFTSICNLLSLMYHGLFTQSQFRHLFGQIRRIENELNFKDVQAVREKYYILLSIIAIETCVIFWRIIKTFINDYNQLSFINSLSYGMVQFGFHLPIFYCYFVLLFLVVILKALNAFLKNVKNNLIDKLKMLKILKDIKLTVNSFSKNFGTIIFIIFWYSFSIAALEMFFIFKSILLNEIRIIIISLVNMSILSPLIILISIIGQECSNVKSSFALVIQSSKNEKNRNNLEEFLHFDYEIDLQFNTNGFFVVDSSLFFQVNLINFSYLMQLTTFHFQMMVSMVSTMLVALQFYQMSI